MSVQFPERIDLFLWREFCIWIGRWLSIHDRLIHHVCWYTSQLEVKTPNDGRCLTLNSELVSLFYTTCEAVWLQNLLAELGLSNNCYILCDNQGAIKTIKNGSLLQGSKHIRVKAHFVKQNVELRNMSLSYISTKDNVADIFTKALPFATFDHLRLLGSLREIPAEGVLEHNT